MKSSPFSFFLNKKTEIFFSFPALILIFFFIFIPILWGLYISFTDYSLLNPSFQFIGLKNYMEVLTSYNFLKSILTTFEFMVISMLIEFPIGLGIALLLNEEFKGKKITVALSLIPWSIPMVVNSLLWLWIYDPQYGLLNGILYWLGIKEYNKLWLGNPQIAMFALIIADSWQVIPFHVLFFLAGLQSIPKTYYEASAIDGANSLKRFFYITLPLLKRVFLILLLIRTVHCIKVFDMIYLMTNGGPGDRTTTMAFLAYLETFDHLKMSIGNTEAIIMSFILIILGTIYIMTLY